MLQGQALEVADHAKYLGVDISSELEYTHKPDICKRNQNFIYIYSQT